MANKKEMGTPKAEQYKEHKVRFKRAMHAECYLECIFIDYAMMEDRLLSILHHLKIADRELGKRGGWAQSPKAKREGYSGDGASGIIQIRKTASPPVRKPLDQGAFTSDQSAYLTQMLRYCTLLPWPWQ